MSRDVGGRRLGKKPPAVLELELSYLELNPPLLPHEHSAPEISVDGNDGSGNMVCTGT